MEGSYYNAKDLNSTEKIAPMGFNYIQLVCLKKKKKRSKTIKAENKKKHNPFSFRSFSDFRWFYRIVTVYVGNSTTCPAHVFFLVDMLTATLTRGWCATNPQPTTCIRDLFLPCLTIQREGSRCRAISLMQLDT